MSTTDETSEVELAGLVRTADSDSGGADEDVGSFIGGGNRATPTKPLASSRSRGWSSRHIILCVFATVPFFFLCVWTLDRLASASSQSDSTEADVGDGTGSGAEDNDSATPLVISPNYMNMRWQSISKSNDGSNCLPRFQLANATLHCGVGGLEPLTSSPNGDEYCGGVRMEPNSCLLPLEGAWSVPNEDDTIPPLPRRFGVNSNNTLPRCKSMEELLNGTHEGVEFDYEWVPKTCSMVPLSPFVWTQGRQNGECQKTITMLGDSHIRNLFTATVNGLRGIEFFTEAHADSAGKASGIAETYEFRLHNNGTATDRIQVFSNTRTIDPHPFEDCNCDVVQRCLRIAFIWAPMFAEQLRQIDYVTKWTSNIVIVEPGNSYEGSTVLSPDWTDKLDKLLQEDMNLELGILRFSWGSQPKEREAALTNWTTTGAYADRKAYLEQKDMTEPTGGMQGRNTFHFGCGLGKENVESDIITAAEPCTDVHDTLQLSALITVLFDALQ